MNRRSLIRTVVGWVSSMFVARQRVLPTPLPIIRVPEELLWSSPLDLTELVMSVQRAAAVGDDLA